MKNTFLKSGGWPLCSIKSDRSVSQTLCSTPQSLRVSSEVENNFILRRMRCCAAARWPHFNLQLHLTPGLCTSDSARKRLLHWKCLQSGRPGTSYWFNIVEQRRPSGIFITLQSNLKQMFRGVLLGVLFQRCLTYVRRLCEQF